MLKDDHASRTGNDRYIGYVVDLIELIAKEINITYEFVLRNDGNGKRDKKTNKWNGIIGEVQEMVCVFVRFKKCVIFKIMRAVCYDVYCISGTILYNTENPLFNLHNTYYLVTKWLE